MYAGITISFIGINVITMGKRSKRSRGKQQHSNQAPPKQVNSITDEDDVDILPPPGKNSQPPALRNKNKDGEDANNLRFEDPFEDVYEEEDIIQDDAVDADDDVAAMDDADAQKNDTSTLAVKERNVATTTTGEQLGGIVEAKAKKAWTPSQGIGNDEQLEMDPTAYKLHHALTAEWPCLTFDFIRDELGEARGRFPHSLLAVLGTQAERSDWNKVTVMKLDDLHGTGRGVGKNDTRKLLGEEEEDSDSESNDSDDDDDESESDDDDGVDLDPVVEHVSLPHVGGVNRLRIMPNQIRNADSTFLNHQTIVSTFADTGAVHFYNLTGSLSQFH
ncbi:MAG: WD40 repeat domain-containing protein, partial [Gloeomargaritales cyanobacterium]